MANEKDVKKAQQELDDMTVLGQDDDQDVTGAAGVFVSSEESESVGGGGGNALTAEAAVAGATKVSEGDALSASDGFSAVRGGGFDDGVMARGGRVGDLAADTGSASGDVNLQLDHTEGDRGEEGEGGLVGQTVQFDATFDDQL